MSLLDKRESADITQASASNIAKYLIEEQVKNDRKMPTFTKMALQAAIQPGNAVDQIAEILYDMGLKISVDKNNNEHKEWLASGAAELEK